jgi:hypothetical protein
MVKNTSRLGDHPSWTFLKSHWESLAAKDFFTVEVAMLS